MAQLKWTVRVLLGIAVVSALNCGKSSSSGGSSGPSYSVPPPPTLTAPQSPGNLTATPVSSTQIQLNWTDYASNESQFQVERSPTGSSYASIGSVGANIKTLTDSGLAVGSTYWYRVRAVNAAGASGYSNVASATTPSVNAWRTMGGDAQHTGFNGAESGGPPLTASWSVALSSAALQPVVVDNGRVFVTSDLGWVATNPVWALDSQNGNQLWNYNFGNVNQVGYPAVSGNLVYVPQNNQTPGTYLWAFNVSTGAVAWSSPIASQWETYWSPVISNGSVWTNGGYYGGLYGFNASSGAQLFNFTSLEQYDQWSPAYYNGTVYTFVAGNLRAHNPTTGAINWTASVNWIWQGWSMRTSPVITGTHALVIAPPNLHAINLTSQSVEWSANATFSGTPAIANGTVFAISGGTLQARSANGLGWQWTFNGDGQLSYPPVVAAGYVYVSSASNTYAVDVSNGQQAWTAAVGGWLSIAEGRLFVARPNGTLQTYTLTP